VAGVGCLLAGSCGGRVLAPAGSVFTDGSRLKAIWEQPPGAPKRQLGWYDTALEAPCAFGYAAGVSLGHPPTDTQYCLPTPAVNVWPDTYGTGLYADAACTQLIVEAGCGERFARMLPKNTSDCGQPLRTFRTGAAAAETYQGDGQGGCFPSGQNPDDGPGWYAPGEEIAVAALVSATTEIPTGDGPRLRPVMLRASDGASQPIAAWDTERGEPVSIPGWWVPDATRSWFPDVQITKWEPSSAAGPVSLYADAGCSNWLGVSYRCGAEPVRSISEPLGYACGGPSSRFYEAGPQVDASTASLFEFVGGTCTGLRREALPLDAATQLFTRGAPIPEDAFADASLIDQGTDRIVMQIPGSADGALDTGTGHFFDRSLRQRCEPLTAADGSLRCLPIDGLAFPDLYADPGCTIPVASFDLPLDGCAGPATPAVASVLQPRTDACWREIRYRMFQVAAPHTGALYWLQGRSCTDATLLLADSLSVFDLGAEIPPEAFVPIATSDHHPPR
jgi:hypothetical protein